MRTLSWMGVWAALALFVPATNLLAEEEKVPLDQVPKAVLTAVKAKFAGAEVREAAKEEEDGKTIYEIVLKHEGHNIDVALKPDGTIVEIEKQIEAADLPKAVASAVAAKYPKSTVKKAEEITVGEKVNYEVVVVTSEKKTIEVKLDAKGKILEAEEGEEKG